VLFGHALDGNAHVNVFDVDPERRVDAEREVLGWVVRRGGAVSAEHGVGVAKRRWLSLMMSPDELDLRARLRRAWDPAGIMNPGVG
jgi:FAD/FMN-containing dehydrogenase